MTFVHLFALQSLNNLIDTKEITNKGEFLTAIYELTKSLSRRLTVRRLSKTYTFVDMVIFKYPMAKQLSQKNI